ncbi:1,2-phenylacetyl-CoA epoxidase subunit PaaD [Elioraea sp.]|uniref:1,2-phenylacetyl-CoA epoxidase subunit PaaD n=1 Tax=Elioraea sp. TaxID=2185103 RepID=UPI00307CCF73
MVSVQDCERAIAAARAAAARVVDPEIPALSIADLGVLREVRLGADGVIEIDITPTYSGCPAMRMIALEVEAAVEAAGLGRPRVNLVLAPAWTTDWITPEGRAALRRSGIAPPVAGGGRRALFGADETVACPRCGATATEKLSEFGSTACKALWRCRTCGEPFDYFKCH